MTVRELINELLDYPMGAEVRLHISKEHRDEYGIQSSGIVFEIDNVDSWGSRPLINFTDWREEQ